ncbi:MAG: transglycosylase domain-containing protein [Thermoanaerobaculia bacterium]
MLRIEPIQRSRRLLWRLTRTIEGRSALALVPCAIAWALFVAIAFSRSGLDAPEPTLLVRDRVGRFVGELLDPSRPRDERLGFWPLAADAPLPERVVAATLAIEDRRFWWHPGVDPLAVLRALRQNTTSPERVSGASTLAMQVARMQHPGARGYLRKALEATTAWIATARYGREAVLRHYLRIVPYGHRIHGIAFAARRYLDKPVEDLSWAEIAFLAAIPQSPSRMDPYDPAGRQRAIRRGRQILDELAARNELSRVDFAAATAEIAHLALPWKGQRPEAALQALLHYNQIVPREVRRERPLVNSTLDLDLQTEVEDLAHGTVRDAADRGAGNAAVIVVDREGWKVIAAVSSIGYFDAGRAGAIDYLRLPRSPGSALKPFIFAQALERGTITPASILDDLEPGPSGIQNSDDRFLGPLLPRVALANSRNVPAVELLSRIGLDEAYGFLGELGLHHHEQSAERFGLGLAIGSLPVSLERLVTAYTTLAGDGTLNELNWYDAPATRSGPVSSAADSGAPSGADEDAAARAPRRFSESTARLVTLFLSDPQARLPTFPRMGFSEYPFAVAVKTGTSSQYRDAWTVAWSKRYLVGVWVGHPDERPMTALSGYRIAARLAQAVIEKLHGDRMDGLQGLDFPPPRGYRSEKLCALSGQRATAGCDRVVLEWIPAGAPPLVDCTAHRRVAIDRRTGNIATQATPAKFIDVRTDVDLPPRYAAWLASHGMEAIDRELTSASSAFPSREAGSSGSAARKSPQRPDLSGTTLARIEIISPEKGLRLLRDPETPPSQNTLALRAVVEPALAQLVWYVDGKPFATVDAPFDARWPLRPGEHTIQARSPFTPARSRLVTVIVE